jgi:hypothetical protein
MAKRWHYQGDINLEYGGTFFDFSEWKHGYATIVQVEDLDSACGFRGAILIEERTVTIDRKERYASALSTIGATMLANGDIDDNGHTMRKNSLAWRMCLAYALNSHGPYDVERSDTVQPDRSESTKFDGWTATRIRSGTLRSFVRKQYLGFRR